MLVCVCMLSCYPQPYYVNIYTITYNYDDISINKAIFSKCHGDFIVIKDGRKRQMPAIHGIRACDNE